jgi:ketosteroid isomerase-like protein
MSKNPIPATTLTDAARQFTRAFNENDLDGVMAWFAEDSVYDQFDGAQARGLDAIRQAFEPQFAGAFGAMKFIEEDLFVDADERKAMISWTCSIETKQGTASWRGLDLLCFNVRMRITRKSTYAKAKILNLETAG